MFGLQILKGWVHVPKDQADDVNMDDDEDDVQEEVEFLPTLQVMQEEDVSSRERGSIPTSRKLWRDRDT